MKLVRRTTNTPAQRDLSNLEGLPGWHLIGSYPQGDPDGVGSWLLHHGGEAMLLETPPGLKVSHVKEALKKTDSALRFVCASHEHEDHLDVEAWNWLAIYFPLADFVKPADILRGSWSLRSLRLGKEPLYLIVGQKHSESDVITVFRGVAMTGDVELCTADSVNDEVNHFQRVMTMKWFKSFAARTNYHVHTTVSAHLNEVRRDVDWQSLFNVEQP